MMDEYEYLDRCVAKRWFTPLMIATIIAGFVAWIAACFSPRDGNPWMPKIALGSVHTECIFRPPLPKTRCPSFCGVCELAPKESK